MPTPTLKKAPVRSEAAAAKPARGFSDDSTLSLYLREISKSKNLTLSEEALLARKIRQGNRQAMNKLIRANLKFVVSVCRNYQNQGLPLSDLINEGNLGLIRAAQRFDETKQLKFISYAVWWIRQAVLQSLAEQSRLIKLPLNRVGTLHKIGKLSVRLEQVQGRAPTVEELSKNLGIKVADIQESLQANAGHVSLDAPLLNEEDGKLMDMLRDDSAQNPEEAVVLQSLKTETHAILNQLDVREEEVLRLYYGIGMDTAHTLEEIGCRFNLTRERVRQIKEKALRRLKQYSKMEKWRTLKP